MQTRGTRQTGSWGACKPDRGGLWPRHYPRVDILSCPSRSLSSWRPRVDSPCAAMSSPHQPVHSSSARLLPPALAGSHGPPAAERDALHQRGEKGDRRCVPSAFSSAPPSCWTGSPSMVICRGMTAARIAGAGAHAAQKSQQRSGAQAQAHARAHRSTVAMATHAHVRRKAGRAGILRSVYAVRYWVVAHI